MIRGIVFPAVAALFYVFLSYNTGTDPSKQTRLENSIPSENSILFKSKGKGGEANYICTFLSPVIVSCNRTLYGTVIRGVMERIKTLRVGNSTDCSTGLCT
jgi:hypothetical protein